MADASVLWVSVLGFSSGRTAWVLAGDELPYDQEMTVLPGLEYDVVHRREVRKVVKRMASVREVRLRGAYKGRDHAPVVLTREAFLALPARGRDGEPGWFELACRETVRA